MLRITTSKERRKIEVVTRFNRDKQDNNSNINCEGSRHFRNFV
jgi:hypothetical protein